VVAADLLRRERVGVLDVGVADDREVLAIILEDTQHAGREVEGGTGLGRRPEVLLQADGGRPGRAVHHLDRHQARARRRAQGRRRRAGRHHRLEKRQCHGDAEALENGTTRKRRSTDDHGVSNGAPDVDWKAELRTMPRMTDEIR
jgi:hypothetical protein